MITRPNRHLLDGLPLSSPPFAGRRHVHDQQRPLSHPPPPASRSSLIQMLGVGAGIGLAVVGFGVGLGVGRNVGLGVGLELG